MCCGYLVEGRVCCLLIKEGELHNPLGDAASPPFGWASSAQVPEGHPKTPPSAAYPLCRVPFGHPKASPQAATYP